MPRRGDVAVQSARADHKARCVLTRSENRQVLGRLFVRLNHSTRTREEYFLQVLVRDNHVDQALRVLKKKMQREGVFREMKRRRFYEKPSERANREKLKRSVAPASSLARTPNARALSTAPAEGGCDPANQPDVVHFPS
jgi:small subunit ribosomal protein S21